jgi:hypothetical protein
MLSLRAVGRDRQGGFMHVAKTFVLTALVRALAKLTAASALAVFAAPALAQPPAFTDLGRFDDASRNAFATVDITPTTVVRWYRVELPRIADPHRFLDMFTSSADAADTEIALYRADGTLIASDDDDGASLFSALSFGIIDPNAPTRIPPASSGGQSAPVSNNGRDGTIVNNASAATAGVYYIAAARYDATFGNNFTVTVTQPATTFSTLLSIRMHTPSGQVSPTINGDDGNKIIGEDSFTLGADTLGTASSASVDLSTIGGSSSEPMSFFDPVWFATVLLPQPLSQIGVFPIVYRAGNALGDVGLDNATLTVRPVAYACGFAAFRPVSSAPGTSVYTYTTTLGDVDGPWTSACYISASSGNDVWFRLNATANGTLSLSTCNADTGATGDQPDTLLGIRGPCFDPVFSACGDDVGGCGLGTRLTGIPIVAGQEYNIAVRAWSTDIADGRLAVTFVPAGPTCNSIDFNNDGGLFDPTDIDAFLSVFSEGPCIPDTAMCSDIDFNNDGALFDPCDIDSFLLVFSEGPCTLCGQ